MSKRCQRVFIDQTSRNHEVSGNPVRRILGQRPHVTANGRVEIARIDILRQRQSTRGPARIFLCPSGIVRASRS
jgi:hypothetical protein